MSKILIIDDDQDILALLKKFLSKHGYEVEVTFSGLTGEKLIDSFSPDLVMCDYRLDDIDGTELLTRIKEKRPGMPVIIITGYSDLRTAVKVVRLGAFDYITKPLIPDEILHTIKQALNKSEAEPKTAKAKSGSAYFFSGSPQSQNLEQQISLVAGTDYSVIIYGESGVGKEGIARMIHEKSERAGQPFVAMDCGAISRDLAGSELFGHEKGSFTGALNQKIGHFEMANGGTLFLDEIGNLPYEIQTLLLRVLQEKRLRRVGSAKEMNVDARIIVASNERLTEVIKQGKFREDLYHRLNEFTIEVPALRTRQSDIMFFANIFLEQTSAELHKHILGFEPEVQEVFLNYPWPGNVRELKNVIKRAALLCTKARLDIKTLPFEILNHAHMEFDADERVMAEAPGWRPKDFNHNHEPSASAPSTGEPVRPNLKKAALEAEYEMIMEALNKSNFNRSKAAGILGIDRKTLYNKMKQMKMMEKQ